MSEHSEFLARSTVKAGDDGHRHKLLRTISIYDGVVQAQKQRQFRRWEDARTRAARVRQYVLENLPDLLETFEQKISARGVKVLWASDELEAQKHLVGIAQKHKAHTVVKAKSSTTEEIHCARVLQSVGMEVQETDLGEFIVQLAGERPSHNVTPCMHKSKQEVSELFHQKLGTPRTENIEDMAMAARIHLREKYLCADIGISGANFLLADEGAVVVVENEGNARLCMACPPVHVVVAGIEKILPRLADLDLFLPLLATSGTGQQMTAYTSIVRGPKVAEEADGPETMYVILLDNGRSKLYGEDMFREALGCIRCGACLNACPVYKTIGGHAYNTAYLGPIGAVITPHMRGMKEWNHLSYASSLCGACTDVCPVKVPLHHLLLMNRFYAKMGKHTSFFWNFVIKVWSYIFRNRVSLNAHHWIFRLGARLARVVVPGERGKALPLPAAKSFSAMWDEHVKS